MTLLSPKGLHAVEEIAHRTGFSQDAVTSMLFSIVSGRGGMAQFSHPEFGGSGQWMAGGVIMISDMFNNGLKARVDALCNELSALIRSEPDFVAVAFHEGLYLASAWRPCSGRRRSLPSATSARPCARHKHGNSPQTHAGSRSSDPRRGEPCRAAGRDRRAWRHRHDKLTGRSAEPCRSARPRRPVDKRDHGLNRRSSSARAK